MRSRIRFIPLQIAAAIVTVLHARLLWRRIEDLSITDPQVMARWGAATIAAAAGLLLLHLRVSRRSWVVFWTVVLLLHAAAPAQQTRLDVLIEVALACAPLILLAARLIMASQAGRPSPEEHGRFVLPTALLAASLPSRAPPAC